MTQRLKTSDGHELRSPLSVPRKVDEVIGELAASNEANNKSERIRALDALAQCMRDAGMGG